MDLLCPLALLNSAPTLQGVRIPILLFADDCVILSESAAGLQDGLCMLWDYCEENSLTVNTTKTKVMSFKTSRSGTYRKLNVMYGEEILESGEIHSSEAPLLQKARRAQFKMSHLSASLPLETVLWLYQRMVDPILLHGCEVWSVIGIGEKVQLLEVYDTMRDGGKHDLIGECMRRDFLRYKIGFA